MDLSLRPCTRVLLYVLFPLMLIQGCKEETIIEEPFEPPLCADEYQLKELDRQIVGFYPSWRLASLPPSAIHWDKISRIIMAFAAPGPEGDINFSSLSSASEITSKAHQEGVEVFFSLGGGGSGSDAFPAAISTASNRTKMIEQILTFLGTHCLDGVDIDYENFQSSGIESNLTLFIKELSRELREYKYKISIDVYPSQWGGVHIDDSINDLVDQVNIMAYDFTGPWSDPGPHSSFDQAIGSGATPSSTGLAYWENYRNFSKEKLLLGVPFYGRDFDLNGGEGVTYSSILAIDEQAAFVSQWDNIYYNGLDLIESKSKHILDNNYTGVMIWELGQDSEDPQYSLLNKIAAILLP